MFFCCCCFCFYQAVHTVSNVGQFYTVPKEISKRVLSPFLTKKFKSQVQYLEVNGGGAKVQVTGHRSGHRSGYRSQATGQTTGHRSGHRSDHRTQTKTIGH